MNCTVCSGELVATGTPTDSRWMCIGCSKLYPWEFNSDALTAIRGGTVSWESLGPVLPGEYYCNGKRIK